MLYTYIDAHNLRLLNLKKSMLGQYEVSQFEKKHTTELLKNGEVSNVDLFASAVKEGIGNLGKNVSNEVALILPQESFYFFSFQVPANYTQQALTGYVADKVSSELGAGAPEYAYDYVVKDKDDQKQVSCFAIKRETIAGFEEALRLLGLKLTMILPEALCVYTLFEKTLRKEKKENIMFASYEPGMVSAYVFDSYGLLNKKKWSQEVPEGTKIQKVLKEKVTELEGQKVKLNRIILSGSASDKIRQDTFTKEAGAWTNPLKRIVPHFYQDYLKVLVTQKDASFPILTFDVCFGAFVFSQEDKKFSIMRDYAKRRPRGSGGGIPFLNKQVFLFILIFAASFAASFYALYALSNAGFLSSLSKLPQNVQSKLPGQAPTPTSAPKPSPTPSFQKSDLRVKVLNGSGTAGKASEAKDLLKEKGYEEILTGNADNFDYKTTVIEIKESRSSFTDTLKKDLKSSVDSPKVTALDPDDASDVIIIVGSDFE